MEETLVVVQDNARKQKLRDAVRKGYVWCCCGCGTLYKSKPTEPYEDGHGGRSLDMCSCGSDLFTRLEEVIAKHCVKFVVQPVLTLGGMTLAFHERNFKHCKCRKGEAWTGDAETECGQERYFKPLPSKRDGHLRFHCSLSGYQIIILSKGPGTDGGYFRSVLSWHEL